MKTIQFRDSRLGRLYVNRIDYHRNGVGGTGFHLVFFRLGRRRYVATVFPSDCRGCYAVLALNADGTVQPNLPQRGDDFEQILRVAINQYDEATGDWATSDRLRERARYAESAT